MKGFVDKNRDVQQDVFFDIISRSSNEFLQVLSTYQDPSNSLAAKNVANGISTVSRGTCKGKPTVCDTFRFQLQSLVDVLQSTTPWYVRCIKPNSDKVPNKYDKKLVLDQLKYLGMLDIIRIRKDGFPVHMSFEDFVDRYRCITSGKLPPDAQKGCLTIISSHNLPSTNWQLGKSKVFLRSHVHEFLEDNRTNTLYSQAVIIQKIFRGYLARKSYLKIRNAVLRIQHSHRAWKLRIEFLRKRRAVIVIQSHLRGVFAREVASALKEMKRVDEEMKKRERLEEERRVREAKEAEEALKRQQEVESNEKEQEIEDNRESYSELQESEK